MTQRLCPRCHAAVHFEDEGSLVFCTHCGAPQVRLSEELREQAERQLRGELPDTTPAAPPDPTAVRWDSVIRYAAATAGLFSLFTLVLPPLALIVPPIVLALYAARHRATALGTGVGASVGLLCGLFTSVGATIIQACGLLALRLSVHGMDEFDANLNTLLLHMKAQVTAQSGAAAAAALDPFLTVPEFRAGLYLTGLALFMGVVVVLSTLTGAVAGYLRRTPRVG